MTKRYTTVGGALASEVNSPLYQKNSLNSKKQKRKGFSVAEAMIALLIGSLALGMAAPMITKQIKQNNINNVQFDVLRREIEALRNNMDNLNNIDNIPAGIIVFYEGVTCPEGWSVITDSKFAGRFPRFTGSFEVSNKVFTVNQTVKTIKSTISITPGNVDDDAIRNITGWYRSTDSEGYGWASTAWGKAGGAIVPSNYTGSYRQTEPYGNTTARDLLFDASKAVPTALENRPRYIGLTGCRKNP